MTDEKFELQPELTGIALAYTNKKYIADEIFPKVPTNRSFQYRKFSKGAFLTVPDTRIGEKGSAPEVNLSSKLFTETVEDHAAKEKIPVSKLEDAAKNARPQNLQAIVTSQITGVLKASRELNLAQKIMNKANYGDNFKELTSAQKVSNPECDAVSLLWSGIDKILYKPNTMVLSRTAMSNLRRNPYVVSACNRTDTKAGVASYQDLKDLFEVDNILVGETIVNTAKNIQTPTFAACWTNDISFMYIDPAKDTADDHNITFGFTAENEPLQIGSYSDPDAGTKGCLVLRGFTSYLDMLTCPECGYLFKGVI